MLISLYSVKNSWKYAPFIISFFGAIFIFSDMLLYDCDYFTYGGNICLIIGAIWNAKLNKFRFGKKK